ncbi:MAG TPA: 6-carboxytetrahydropterin synthase [Thermoanaerobaculia bacterium]|nr:6-carboxytetrahydropterin synthase [Thermoanaerobaculia bacterium]
MSELPRYRIALAKEDFKFSAAHFTLFEGGRAELLHGHNYRVEVELSGGDLDGSGLLLDLESFKRFLRALCHRLDNRTLLPADCPRLRWTRQGDAVEVELAERSYRFPAAEVLLLPLANTSMELLARMIWHDIAPHLADSPVETLAVAVEESAGQRCWYEAPLRLLRPLRQVPPVKPASPAPSS